VSRDCIKRGVRGENRTIKHPPKLGTLKVSICRLVFTFECGAAHLKGMQWRLIARQRMQLIILDGGARLRREQEVNNNLSL